MNNKGFAITTILYGIMILFCLLLVSLLGILSSYRKTQEVLIENNNGARSIVSSSILPREYQLLNYIQTNGTQSIDTGISSSNNIVAIFDVEYTETSTNTQVLLSTGSSGDQWIGQHDSKYGIGTGSDYKLNISSSIRKKLEITFDSSKTALQIEDASISRDSNHNTGNNYYIFSLPNGQAFSKVKLYSAKIYDNNNNLLRNFYPCYQISDNVVGLYDIVTKTFYTDKNGNSFNRG